jgi:hypothetical protein
MVQIFPTRIQQPKRPPLLEYIVSHFGHCAIVVGSEKKIPFLWFQAVPKNAAHVSARLPFQAKMCINNLRHHFPQPRKNYGRTQLCSSRVRVAANSVWRIRG